MQTYLYGLVLARNAHLIPAHITGIAKGEVRVLDCGALGAIVSALDRPVARELEDVRAHDHALQSIVHHGATAAAGRFGQTFSSDRDAREHVREHGDRIARVLDALDGCVEMRLLMPIGVDREDPGLPLETSPGRAYLERVKSERDALDRLGLRAALGPVVRAEKVEELPRGRGVAFSHLIDRNREGDYREAVATLPALSDATLVGPLALYAFTEPQ